MATFHRLAIAGFFLLVVSLKLVDVVSAAPAPDINGMQVPGVVIVGIVLFEAVTGIGLRTRRWTVFAVAALAAFLGFSLFAVLQLAGVATSDRCGCLGPVEVGAWGRLMIGLGGLVSVIFLLVASIKRNGAPRAHRLEENAGAL